MPAPGYSHPSLYAHTWKHRHHLFSSSSIDNSVFSIASLSNDIFFIITVFIPVVDLFHPQNVVIFTRSIIISAILIIVTSFISKATHLSTLFFLLTLHLIKQVWLFDHFLAAYLFVFICFYSFILPFDHLLSYKVLFPHFFLIFKNLGTNCNHEEGAVGCVDFVTARTLLSSFWILRRGFDWIQHAFRINFNSRPVL